MDFEVCQATFQNLDLAVQINQLFQNSHQSLSFDFNSKHYIIKAAH